MQFAHPLRMKIHLQQDDDDDDDDGARSRITFARRRARPFDAKIMPPFRREYPRYCKATRWNREESRENYENEVRGRTLAFWKREDALRTK